ncbi:hypothetical protein SAMN05421812_101502 [Asanoa hainanensis]|uniref:Uncharacterized protein n=1 Tax=Asanoa hainanensis TaxID=560556 RepID=A0A239GQW3_9ACTN|nr:hypothetical protein [Asanoa hainanensis]SNS70903.1 hypothetical protein SAMN05421812_101502 [Asanoa hainanensis]
MSGPVPAEHAAFARRLRAAEDRLYPLAMVDTDLYERAVRLVGRLAGRLAETCTNLDELAAAEASVRGWLDDGDVTGGVPVAGLDPDMVVSAALAARFRALLGEQAAALRARALDRARAAGLAWAVLEQPDAAAWRGASARWVEAHVHSGTVLVRSVVADPDSGAPLYRIEVYPGVGDFRVAEFDDRATWESTVEDERRSVESES